MSILNKIIVIIPILLLGFVYGSHAEHKNHAEYKKIGNVKAPYNHSAWKKLSSQKAPAFMAAGLLFG